MTAGVRTKSSGCQLHERDRYSSSFRGRGSDRSKVLADSCFGKLASLGLVVLSQFENRSKEYAARAGASMVEDGMVVGLGSGSTAALMVEFLAARVEQEGLRILGVPTSRATAALATQHNIPLLDLDQVPLLDINIDGADEIDGRYRMIKGRGGALLREKIAVSAAKLRVTMITKTKQVTQLGMASPIPVEVSTFGMTHTERLLKNLGATTSIRRTNNQDLALTDGGNAIIDCKFWPLVDVSLLDSRLQQLAGVLETGLFIGLCDTLIVGSEEGVEIIRTDSPKVV